MELRDLAKLVRTKLVGMLRVKQAFVDLPYPRPRLERRWQGTVNRPSPSAQPWPSLEHVRRRAEPV